MWLASRRHQFNEIKMIKCGSLSYLLYPQNVASAAADCRCRIRASKIDWAANSGENPAASQCVGGYSRRCRQQLRVVGT